MFMIDDKKIPEYEERARRRFPGQRRNLTDTGATVMRCGLEQEGSQQAGGTEWFNSFDCC
jgi:hypothetical protein